MNHAIKLDERAFNEGVREILELRPLRRITIAIATTKHGKKRKTQTDKASLAETSARRDGGR